MLPKAMIVAIVGLLSVAQAGKKTKEGPHTPSPSRALGEDDVVDFHRARAHWGKWPISDKSIINWELLHECFQICVKDTNVKQAFGFDVFTVTRREFCKPTQGKFPHSSKAAEYKYIVEACASDQCYRRARGEKDFTRIWGDFQEFMAQVCDNPAGPLIPY